MSEGIGPSEFGVTVVRAAQADGELEQAELFERGDELLSIDEDAKRGRFSGKIIEARREKVELIWSALEVGWSLRRIADRFKVSQHTVIELRRRHPGLSAQADKRLSATLEDIQHLGWERYKEALIKGEIAPAALPVGLGIAADKKAALDGKPTVIVEHRDGSLNPEALNELIAKLPRAQVIDVGSSDSASDGGGQNGQ